MKSYINPLLVCNGNDYFCLRVSKGCLGKCSYCVIRSATGILQSRQPQDVIGEFRKGLEAGHKVFYITAEDSGAYGLDIATTSLALLKEIFEAGKDRDFKLIVTNFNAQWFAKYYLLLEPLFLANRDKMLYLQVPIQSGSNRILRLMNRPYDIDEVSGYLERLQSKAPSLNIATDIIVGFPQETEEDFEETRKLLRRIRFSFAEIFAYEDRPNTAAAAIKDKVPAGTIDRRKFELLRIQNKQAAFGAILKKASDLRREFT
jgi:MiaB/RimO family radical SAM methylthiotransferase